MRLVTKALVSFVTITQTGCFTPRTDSFFVQGERLQAMPADWRSCPLSIHEFKGEDGSVRAKVYSDELAAVLESAGFLGPRDNGENGLVVFWSTSDSASTISVPRREIRATGGGSTVSPFYASGPAGDTSGLIVTHDTPSTEWVSTTSLHAITAFSLQIVILDGRQELPPESFRGRCLIKAIDQPVGSPFSFAAKTLLENFPGAPHSEFNFEVGKLPAK